MESINWPKIEAELRYDPHSLIDVVFKKIGSKSSFHIIKWLKENPALNNISWYDPLSNKNYDVISKKTYEALEHVNFYLHAQLKFGGMFLFVSCVSKDEIMCDISPKEIRSESEFILLLNILDKIASLAQVKTYTFQAESSDHIIWQRDLFPELVLKKP